MKNSVELMDKKNLLKVQAEALIKGAEMESRKLNAEEQTNLDSIKKQINDIDTEIRELNKTLNKETRSMEKFSLLTAINDVANNRQLDERSQEVINAGMAEMRKSGLSFSGQILIPVEQRADIQATVDTAGKEAVATDKLNILEPLKAKMVLSEAGATYMTGLVGNISIPSYSGATVGWADETGAAADGAGTFDEVEFAPKRLTAYIDVSKQFLIQDSVSAEALIRKNIVEAISQKLEATILGDGAGSTKQPAGIFNGVTALKDNSYQTFAEMLQKLEEANVYGDIKYIVSPAIKAQLKTTAKTEGAFVMEDNEVDGIPVLSTSACKGIVLGNFENYVIAQWGAIDLTIDPYSQAANGKVRLVVNAYFDAKPVRKEAFVANKAKVVAA